MNKRSMRTKSNLAITVMMAIVGIVLIWIGNELYVFRLDGGYGDITFESEYIQGIFALLVFAVEWIFQLLGIGCLLAGLVGIYNNVKKMMR